ncbi:hypothetical protein SCOR_18790 [Sulfidibacter corallicola]
MMAVFPRTGEIRDEKGGGKARAAGAATRGKAGKRQVVAGCAVMAEGSPARPTRVGMGDGDPPKWAAGAVVGGRPRVGDEMAFCSISVLNMSVNEGKVKPKTCQQVRRGIAGDVSNPTQAGRLPRGKQQKADGRGKFAIVAKSAGPRSPSGCGPRRSIWISSRPPRTRARERWRAQ